jgi:glutamate--cysteine ligase
MGTWLAIDNTRAKPALNGADPRDAWASYALRANVMFLRTDPTYQSLREPLSFGAWIEDGHEHGYPTAEDLTYHLTTLFPPVRPRGWLELRMIDMVPDPWWRVAAVVTTALVCHDRASAIADDATKATADLWYEAARHGMRHPLLRASVQQCFAAAMEALDDIGSDKRSSAAVSDYIDRYVSRGRCPADDQLESWSTNEKPTTGRDA